MTEMITNMQDTTGKSNTTTTRTIHDAWLDTLINDGGTFDAQTFAPVVYDTGYIVSIREHGSAYVMDATEAWLASLWQDSGLVGTWVDRDTALMYVDSVIHTPYDVIARDLQALGAQVSVWDCSRKCAVDLLSDKDV